MNHCYSKTMANVYFDYVTKMNFKKKKKNDNKSVKKWRKKSHAHIRNKIQDLSFYYVLMNFTLFSKYFF